MRRTVLSIAMAMVAALGTVAAHAGDQEIADAVLQQLKQHQDEGQLKGFNIKLSVKEGRVWMKGSVADQEQHKLAIESARHVEGVTMVVNELTVGGESLEHPEQQMTLPQRARNFLARQREQSHGLQQPPSVANEPEATEGREPVIATEFPLAGTTGTSGPVQLASREQVVDAMPAIPSTKLPARPAVDELLSGSLPELPPKRELQESIAATEVPDLTKWQQPAETLQVAAPPTQVTAVPTQLAAAPTQVAAAPTQVAAAPTNEQQQVQMVAMPIFVPQPVYQAPPQQPSGRPAAIADSNLPGSQQLRQARQQQAQQQQAARMAAMHQQHMMRMAMMQRQGGVPAQQVAMQQQGAAGAQQMAPSPQYIQGTGGGVIPARYDHPQMPGYSWPSYASHPNYAALQYPKQHAAHAWPYIGPFYPYPQVPLGWRKVTLSWDDGWWFLDFKDKGYGPYITR